jgi:hypothetical protein
MKLTSILCLFLELMPANSAANPPQTVSEAALKEADRRKLLEQQGVEGKTILQGDVGKLGAGANVTSGTPLPPASRPATARESPPKPDRYRSQLLKLDGEIRRMEEKLSVLRSRLETERHFPFRLGRTSNAVQKTEAQIRSYADRIERLRLERMKVYDAGLRAGFLPGELDGKGIVP